jgi:DNA-binding response OmpR family regulator
MNHKTAPKIVVVDNSSSVKSLFERGTADLDVELLVFATLDEANQYLQDHRPDLLFLNIKLPGKDGLIYLKELRQLPLHKTTSVVMISSKDYAQDRAVASQLGVVEFVTIPLPIKAVTNIISKYTNG